jgi:hypothetical protein
MKITRPVSAGKAVFRTGGGFMFSGYRLFLFFITAALILCSRAGALERPDTEFGIFQFPADMIPRIDGDPGDWNMVPAGYRIGIGQLEDTKLNEPVNKDDLDVTVRIGWVEGMGRLYFLVEMNDDYWDFEETGSRNDMFELVIDGDLSGGPLIPQLREDKTLDEWEGYTLFHGIHAQNYHINTPAVNKPWTLVWGCQPWIRELPWANAAYSYDFKPGESGKLTLEFWITPFDYAPYDGPERSVATPLLENGILGISWAVIDYDGPGREYSFFNLSHKPTMYGNASDLVAFRLMPVESFLRESVKAEWSFGIVDLERRIVAFKDESHGTITSWLWEFSDGTTSTEQNPVHTFKKGTGYYSTTILTVTGPEGTSKMSKPWDVYVK